MSSSLVTFFFFETQKAEWRDKQYPNYNCFSPRILSYFSCSGLAGHPALFHLSNKKYEQRVNVSRLDAVRVAGRRTAICNVTLTFSLFYNVIGWLVPRAFTASATCAMARRGHQWPVKHGIKKALKKLQVILGLKIDVFFFYKGKRRMRHSPVFICLCWEEEQS